MKQFDMLRAMIKSVDAEAERLGALMLSDKLLPALERAAEAWASENERRADAGEPLLSLDLASAFAGLVLEASVRRQRTGSPGDKLRAAFVLNDKAGVVKGRNHTATFDRLEEYTKKLREALAVQAPARPRVPSVKPGESDAAVMR